MKLLTLIISLLFFNYLLSQDLSSVEIKKHRINKVVAIIKYPSQQDVYTSYYNTNGRLSKTIILSSGNDLYWDKEIITCTYNNNKLIKQTDISYAKNKVYDVYEIFYDAHERVKNKILLQGKRMQTDIIHYDTKLKIDTVFTYSNDTTIFKGNGSITSYINNIHLNKFIVNNYDSLNKKVRETKYLVEDRFIVDSSKIIQFNHLDKVIEYYNSNDTSIVKTTSYKMGYPDWTSFEKTLIVSKKLRYIWYFNTTTMFKSFYNKQGLITKTISENFSNKDNDKLITTTTYKYYFRKPSK